MTFYDVIHDGLPYLLSCITIWMTLLAGNNHRYAWFVGLVNQALWLTWVIVTKNWGFFPLNVALTIVYLRNHLKWNDPLGPSSIRKT